ncbi:hypothetical protein F5X68DRAFT_272777 [Plectosphaerella plurivora]|uniref:Uncharacterized protein n=1 Tax=Plectosphaerella plurivora TaxID=936078 RepID=A0A9P8VJ01_9PEZI|nr:hypothetical protein F5X68DRAFT_272777 [Plectosphaerella plurivora]
MSSNDHINKQRLNDDDVIHQSAAEKDPNYDQELMRRGAPQDFLITKTRVVKSIPEQKEKKPNGKLKSFFGKFKSPALRRYEEAPKVEGKTYHTNEKGEIIETTTTKAAGRPGWAAGTVGMGDGSAGGG